MQTLSNTAFLTKFADLIYEKTMKERVVCITWSLETHQTSSRKCLAPGRTVYIRGENILFHEVEKINRGNAHDLFMLLNTVYILVLGLIHIFMIQFY